MTTARWLLGAPFDVVTLDEVCERVRNAARKRERLLFVTPNISFLAEAARSERFRTDILRSELSLADGAPVVWLGRLIGIPFPERVAGSDVLQSLIAQADPRPIRIFFFGGEPGASQEAFVAVNKQRGGAVAVGFHYPGFVSVEQMSDEATIELINRTNADFLVVALGAAKGHRWMEMNRDRLNVPVISHLGAAVNFVSGRLHRAPPIFQRLGLEWLWRIKEEPALFRRYARDGWFFLCNATGFLIREALSRNRHPDQTRQSMQVADTDEETVATLSGTFCENDVAKFEQILASSAEVSDKPVRVNFKAVTRFDAFSIGWIYSKSMRNPRRSFRFQGDSKSRAAARHWRADFLLDGATVGVTRP